MFTVIINLRFPPPTCRWASTKILSTVLSSIIVRCIFTSVSSGSWRKTIGRRYLYFVCILSYVGVFFGVEELAFAVHNAIERDSLAVLFQTPRATLHDVVRESRLRARIQRAFAFVPFRFVRVRKEATLSARTETRIEPRHAKIRTNTV